MGHTSSIEYAKRAKQGFLLGAVLSVAGALGELLAHTVVTVPEWEQTLFLDAVVVGTLVALLSVFVFGIALPLVE